MRPQKLFISVAAVLMASSCANTPASSAGSVLTEDQVLHLMEHPRRWDGRTLLVRMYPYDVGFSGAYVVCFEPCDRAYAEKSPFLLNTAAGRFRGYTGNSPVDVRATYSSTCFYRYNIGCMDFYFGRFTEVNPGLDPASKQ
jgi:hypothetical protein